MNINDNIYSLSDYYTRTYYSPLHERSEFNNSLEYLTRAKDLDCLNSHRVRPMFKYKYLTEVSSLSERCSGIECDEENIGG